MLKREEAQKILEAAQVKNPDVLLAQRIATLPKNLATKTLDFLMLDSHGKDLQFSDWEKRNQFYETAHQVFYGISEKDFAAVLEVWFPRFSQVAKAALSAPESHSNGFQSHTSRTLQAQIDTSQQWLEQTKNYDQPLEWFAEYAAYNWSFGHNLTHLFVADIDLGNPAVFNIMLAAAKNEHPVAIMGDTVVESLLRANQTEGWEIIEKTLLAAQRQEGLRQSIFNQIGSAHPTALKRMLGVILEHDLLRFSSSVQWAQGFLPLVPPEPTPKVLENSLKDFIARLENQETNHAVAQDLKATPTLQDLYLALYCLAFVNLETAQSLALPWLKHPDAKYRFLALHGLAILDAANLQTMITDPDDLVALKAHQMATMSTDSLAAREASFGLLEDFLRRFPNPIKLAAPESWLPDMTLEPSQIAAEMYHLLDETQIALILPYKHLLEPWTLRQLIEALTKKTPWAAETRGIVVEALTHKDNYLREKAFEVMQSSQVRLEEAEFVPLEKQLSRKTASVRQSTIELILAQPAEFASASATRLKATKTPEQKKAGAEIEQALEWQRLEQNAPSPLDGFGLFNPKLRTPAFGFERKNIELVTPAALALLTSLEKLVWSQRLTVVDNWNWSDEIEQKPFENAYLRPPRPNQETTILEQWQKFPLSELWTNWFLNRSAKEQDMDGLELLRAMAIRPFMFNPQVDEDEFYVDEEFNYELEIDPDDAFYANTEVKKTYFTKLKPKKPKETDAALETSLVKILGWLNELYPPANQHDFALDVLEDQLAQSLPILEQTFATFVQKNELLPDEKALEGNKAYETFKRQNPVIVRLNTSSQTLSAAQKTRSWQLEHGLGLRLWWSHKRTINLDNLMAAWLAGVANQTDVMEALIGPEHLRPEKTVACNHGFTQHLQKEPTALVKTYPQLQPLLEQCANRVLEIELARGDLPTPATGAASSIRFLSGLGYLVQILSVLSQDNISRGGGYYYGDEAPRLVVFSNLLKAVYPSKTDTQAEFSKAIKKAGIPEQRLLELGLFAPQWTQFVAQTIGWKGLSEGMYWLRAHTKDTGYSSEEEGWRLEMAQLTPLTTQDLIDGAVDVAWFHQVYKDLGTARWTQLYDSAKYITSGTGHARAKQFADAMLGKLVETQVVTRITSKRHQDSLRALGLLPLPKSKDIPLLKRYEVIQTFLKESKQFGSQRKESERLAARIGLENLARTAGYPDPMRLEWAMELKAVADLSKGAVKLVKGDVELILSVSPEGEPKLEVQKAGKILKDIPANLKKDQAVIEIRARRKELEVQASRMRVSLERAMIHGDQFSAKELRDLTKHPMVKPMLEQLVFIDQTQMGFLSGDGKNLVSPVGELLEIISSSLRLAHPVDLLESGKWSEFQAAFFSAKRQQPFKQIFRELYLLTPAELEQTQSSRYAGHQVNQRQSAALLGSRGWVVNAYEGDASRTFFAEGITAHISSKQGWTTPAEVEAPALDTIRFTKRNEYEALDLQTIPKRLYSEIMRDLDLVVSVAHVGGVDPEASQSTTEMRSALLLETLRLLKISNVKLEKSVALIEGSIGRYSVHLGSAVVHQQPGGAICLVAVPNQARGRIFLPFADSDPRTAEVIAKVLMLAKDSEIQDPILLRQLVG